METLSYLDAEGNLKESYPYTHSEDFLLKYYRVLLLTRLMDEKMITLQRQGVITFALSSFGEEACSVAAAAALELSDWLYPQYRESGVLFARGFSPLLYVHQMFGDADDLGKGRQMPNHFGSRELNVVTVSSPIGTKIPHAAGCAYAMKYQREESVAVAFFGEGATSEGDFHAGLNFASVLNAPALFFCRNNGYAISTPVRSQFHSEGVAPKAAGYGMEAIRLDGNDFFAVYAGVKQAREHALSGKGPVLIEAMTYRRGAHSTSDDPSVYRTREEEKEWESRDPIRRFRLYLEKRGFWNEQKEKALFVSIESLINEAIAIAKNTPKPALKTLIEDVYFVVPETLRRELR